MSHYDQDPDAEQIRDTEARIARALSAMTAEESVAGVRIPPPAYVRRHLVEHAHAGNILDDETIPDAFLPFLDVTRFMEVSSAPSSSLYLALVIRQASLSWNWNDPDHNAKQLSGAARRLGLRPQRAWQLSGAARWPGLRSRISVGGWWRSVVVFSGAALSAGLLAFVSLSQPYTTVQISMLVIGSVTAGLATALVEGGLGTVASRTSGAKRPPIGALQRLTLLLTRLLPQAARRVYGEAWLVELAEIAATKSHRRRAQWGYVVRIAVRVPATRKALIRAARKAANKE